MTPSKSLGQRPAIASVPMTDCVVCAGKEWRIVGSGQDFEYESCSNTWTYQACTRCGHVQIAELPAPDMLSVIYPSNYYSYSTDSIHPIARWAKRKLDNRKFARILSARLSPVTSYLDVGCGDGRYLECMIERGVPAKNVYGVEINPQPVKDAINRGLQVRECRIETATHLPNNYFDLITMFHVIEHVAQPGQVIRRLRDLLRPNGILAIETPNFDSLDARVARKRFWGGYHIPRHWHIFIPESMTRLLQDSGLTVAALNFQTGHAFWMWTLHHWLKYGKSSPALAELCHPLRNLPFLAAVTAFDISRATLLQQRTSSMLVLARKDY
jgi:2-polyprenyl-3-methyl-5-hydroxy-6-metoxy-1,4-benzoquinol methylase